MKLSYFAFFILLFPSSFFAQDYIPLVVEDKHWVFHKCGTLGDELSELFEHLIRGDTMIAGQMYKKVYKRSFYIEPASPGSQCDFIEGENPQTPPYTIIDTDYIGAIREDASKKVFFKPAFQFSNCVLDNEEHLLFDFEPEIGDTTLVCAGFSTFQDTLTVSEFTTATFFGERNTIKYQKEGVNGELFYSLHEGVGSRLGITQHWSLSFQVDCGYYSLKDFCIGTDEECIYTNTAVHNILPTESVKIIPSPSNGNFSLQLERELGQNTNLQIISSQGSLVLEQVINNPTVNISVDLPTGLYFLSIIENGRQIWSGKTIIKD